MSGLPNPQNSRVGRGLTDHHFDTIIGVMPFDTGSSKGPGSAARRLPRLRHAGEHRGHTRRASRVFTFSDAGIAGFYDNGALGDAHGADSVGRLVGAELMSAMSEVDKLLSIAVLTDDDVEEQNRVTLSTTSPSGGPFHWWRYAAQPFRPDETQSNTWSSKRCDSCGPPGRARCIDQQSALAVSHPLDADGPERTRFRTGQERRGALGEAALHRGQLGPC